MLETLAFYLFATILVGSAVMVVSARNPVHSVLFLILSFFNAAGLFVLLGAEFIAMILVIVYVGAVAVLFLFVVMMLDIGVSDIKRASMRYIPIGLFTGGVLLTELYMIYKVWGTSHAVVDVPVDESISNTQMLGQLIYTDYIYAFQVAGLILFVAMIGAIVLTHRNRPGVRRQKVAAQNARTREDAVEIQKVSSGAGV